VAFDVDTDHLDELVRHLAQFGIRSLTSHPPTLEELFLRHYGDELAADVGYSPDGDAGHRAVGAVPTGPDAGSAR
jgi:ABC-2 type transport system ATP-binding protein